jgi:hypothetical protein
MSALKGTSWSQRQAFAVGFLRAIPGLDIITGHVPLRGAVAQLGERLVRNEEVSGSIPLSSTIESRPLVR